MAAGVGGRLRSGSSVTGLCREGSTGERGPAGTDGRIRSVHGGQQESQGDQPSGLPTGSLEKFVGTALSCWRPARPSFA